MNKSVELSDQALFSFQDPPGKAKPIVMANLLRFSETAEYDDEQGSCSGEQAHSKYAKAVVPLIFEVGGFPV